MILITVSERVFFIEQSYVAAITMLHTVSNEKQK